jgi:hypothetical protein
LLRRPWRRIGGINKIDCWASGTQFNFIAVIKHFGLYDSPAIQQRSVKASQIKQHILSVLPANLCMTARNNRCGSIDYAFYLRIASETSNFFGEFKPVKALRSCSR